MTINPQTDPISDNHEQGAVTSQPTPRTLASRITRILKPQLQAHYGHADLSTTVYDSGTVHVTTDRELGNEIAEAAVTKVMGTQYVVTATRPPSGGNSRFTYVELMTPAAVAAQRAAQAERIEAQLIQPADESSDFVDQGTGRRSAIRRFDQSVVVYDRAEDGWKAFSHKIHRSVAEARADYANWHCDDNANQPQPGDVIDIYGTRRNPRRITVAASAPVPGQELEWFVTGDAGTFTVRLGAFHYVTRPATPPPTNPVCIAERFSSSHPFESGTQADVDRARDDIYEVCEKPADHPIHQADDDGDDYPTPDPEDGDDYSALATAAAELRIQDRSDDFVASLAGVNPATIRGHHLVEALAVTAAQRQAAEDLRLHLEEGKYPGLCEAAWDDACGHSPRHVIPADFRAKYQPAN